MAGLRAALASLLIVTVLAIPASRVSAQTMSKDAIPDWDPAEVQNARLWPQKIYFAFQRGEFDRIERWHALASKVMPQLPDGSYTLGTFYAGFNVPELVHQRPEMEAAVEADWEAGFARWRHAYPNSPAAYVAQAMSTYNWAWRIRGSGYVHEVADDDMQRYAMMIERARTELEAHMHIARTDPFAFFMMLRLEFESFGDHRFIHTRVAESLNEHPGHFAIMTMASRYMLPRWGGDEALYYDWADAAAAAGSETHGTGLLARIYWLTGGPSNYADIVDRGPYWDKLKQALSDKVTHYPHIDNRRRFLNLACIADDFEAANEQFEILLELDREKSSTEDLDTTCKRAKAKAHR